jgi:hypothetical protein
LFGGESAREKPVRLGNNHFVYFGLAKGSASFLPERWHQELHKVQNLWQGCERWWSGYPMICWLEMRPGDGDARGYLKLHAEVGPVSDHKVRKGLIRAIEAAASEKELSRVKFEVGAVDKGRLYSRFLRDNSFAVQDSNDIDEHILRLLSGFNQEFEAIAVGLFEFLNRTR